MTAPPLKGRKLVCANKRRHPDELVARAAAMDSITRYANTAVLYVYHCEHCNGWHLSKRRNNNGAVTANDPVAERKLT
jgi:hypothetical protein